MLADAEAKVKAAREAAIRMATEVKAKAEAEGKAKTDTDELRQRLEAEMKAKLEEERKAREVFAPALVSEGKVEGRGAYSMSGSNPATLFESARLQGDFKIDKGTVKITNAAIWAGAMNAGASLEIDAGGGLSGRVVADVKMPNQTLRATLNISGKIQDPVIRK